MDFSFLNEFKLSEAVIKERGMKKVCKLKHNFFSLPEYDMQEVFNTFTPFPVELKQFYQEIGFGFFHINRGRIHRILDPQSLIFINQQRDEYKRDKILAESIKEGQLVFFDSQAYGYFSLEMESAQKKNAVYYKGEKIESNLFDFINNIHKDKNYLKYMRDDAEEALMKKNLRDKKAEIKNENRQPLQNIPVDKSTSKNSLLLESDDSFVIS